MKSFSEGILPSCWVTLPPDAKRASTIALVCLLASALSGALIWCALLYHHHGSLGFRCGLLPTASDPYLDGSRKLFQKCSWHLGSGTRTWGETYGVKLSRLYLSMDSSDRAIIIL